MRRHGTNSFTISLALATATFAQPVTPCSGPAATRTAHGCGTTDCRLPTLPGWEVRARPRRREPSRRPDRWPPRPIASSRLASECQPGARPVVSVVGTNQLYRFALEYEGVPLAAGTDYVAVLHSTGRVLASRARNLPETVDGTQPTTDAATASSIAAADARQTFGLAGTADRCQSATRDLGRPAGASAG